ncbi:MAG: hypothetical protein V7750_10015 [Sneathiella sp.]
MKLATKNISCGRSLVIWALLLALLKVNPASAHAIGVRYELPLPLWLYLAGAGLAVALSFAIMALFLKIHKTSVNDWQFNLLTIRPFRWLALPLVLTSIRALSVAAFILLIGAGFFGNPDPFKNIAPTFIWVIWWVGVAFTSSLIGNLWDLLNPWKTCFEWAGKLRKNTTQPHPYPAWLGLWPAAFFLLIFAWMELISVQSEQPSSLALLIVIYSAITWSAMKHYGQEIWLERGEVFTVIFTLLARFAPTHGKRDIWSIRLPAVGLLSSQPARTSTVFFVLILLTSVTFDGLLETPAWAALLAWISESHALRPYLISFQNAGIDLIVMIKTVALILFPLMFIATYYGTSAAIVWAAGSHVSMRDIAGYFVFSIVPIAIAYHLSHYLSYLLIAGQNIIPLISDPFGMGWNLFGTTSYTIDIGIVNAEMIWFLSVTAIITGHILAVYLAHIIALRVFENRAQALRSQIPMLFLMVSYTMISLWVLSQPIITK